MRRAVLVALLGGWLLAGVVTAGPASAHANLVTTDPGEGARVAQMPSAVTLTFSEGVSLGAGYARVLGAKGQRVDAGTASVDGDVLSIPLRTGLPDGGYLVTYRVISADSHPVAGAYSFVVGNGSLVATGLAGSQNYTNPVVGAGLPVSRWIGFAGLALAVGVPVLVLLCWPGGWRSVRLGRLATWGAVAVAAGALGSFLLQGPYAAASGPGSMFDPSLLGATVGSEAGQALLVRLVLALGLAAVLWRVWRRGDAPSTGQVVIGGLLAAGAVVSTAAIGHPVAGSWPALAIPVTVVHVAAMALWLGGLTGLLAGVLRPGVPADDVAGAVSRYSRLAFGSVVALVVTGVVQAVREVESPTALFDTTYGWVLVAKLVLVGIALAAAGVSRVWVQQRLGVRRPRRRGRRSLTAHAFAATGDEGVEAAAQARGHLQSESAAEHVPALRRSVLVEAAVAAVVLALSAVLVGLPPARGAVSQPVDAVLPLESATGPSGSVQVSVDPAKPGSNTLHLYLSDDSGQVVQPLGVTVTLTERDQQIGPLLVKLKPGGPGHYIADGMDIPGAGTWTLSISVRVTEFTATTASTDFPVR